MVLSTALLLREQGYTGTSFSDVLQHSGAPRGSIYHHFPGGKSELVEAALSLAGRYIGETLDRAVEAGDPILALNDIAEGWRMQLRESDHRAGCPIVAVAAEVHDDRPQLLDAAAAVFDAWQATLATLLRDRGVPRARARRLARLAIASIEGRRSTATRWSTFRAMVARVRKKVVPDSARVAAMAAREARAAAARADPSVRGREQPPIRHSGRWVTLTSNRRSGPGGEGAPGRPRRRVRRPRERCGGPS